MRSGRARRRRKAAAGRRRLAVILLAPLALLALSYQGGALSGVPTPRQLMALLDARSPGERPEGALAQSKKRAPPQRALGKIFRKPPPMEQLAKVVVPPPVQFVPPPEEPVEAGIIPPSVLLASLPPVTGTDLLNPPFKPVVNVPPPPVNSAVPEPGTWMMMLIGFGMVGAAMRGRRLVPARMQVA